MQQPINEQYFELWKDLDKIEELRKEASLPPWKAEFEMKVQELQDRIDQLDQKAKEKWLPLFRPVYDHYGLLAKNEDEEMPGLMSKLVWYLIQIEKRILSGKLMKIFQMMEFDTLKQPGKCNCQLKNDTVSVLNDMSDLDISNMRKWERPYSTFIYQCRECGIYWQYTPRSLKLFGVPWRFLGKEVEVDLEENT